MSCRGPSSFVLSKLLHHGRRGCNINSRCRRGAISSSSSSSIHQMRCLWSCPVTSCTSSAAPTLLHSCKTSSELLPFSCNNNHQKNHQQQRQQWHFFSSSSSAAAAAAAASSSSAVSNTGEGFFDKVAVIGTGVMAQAILEPLIRHKIQPADKITVYDVNDQLMDEIVTKFGVKASRSLSELVEGANFVLCAVKPQNLTAGFFKEIQKGMLKNEKTSDDAILLSIVAGKSLSAFEEGGFTKIVRSMPNTPAKIGQGMTVWSCTPNLNTDERQKIRKVLGTFGEQLYVDDESFIDMATSISGSGPAYIFLLMEAMIDAGVHMGFPRDKATTLVYHTMLGSTLYAMETKEHPAVLRNSVTSPSGTTASALYELESGKFRTVVQDAVWACYRRSLEMGNQDSNVGPGRTHQRVQVAPIVVQQQQHTTTTTRTSDAAAGGTSTTDSDRDGLRHRERVK